jgi:ABC-type Fe3+-hydroxamate transport system substrate-binding protein
MFLQNANEDRNKTPQRIISLVPSQTELLYDLGLDTEVVGITKFCVHPDVWFRTKQRVGGTKQLHLDRIRQLSPDLIIANKEENVRDQVEAAARLAPVWMSDVKNLDDAIGMIRGIGDITCKSPQADVIVKNIVAGFRTLLPVATPLRTLYLIWRNPWMSVGADTFIHDMMARAGLQNVCADMNRYPELSEAMLLDCAPELVLLSSEPYPFSEKHIAGLQSLLPKARILLVDGELFSWYGSRLLHTPAYLKQVRERADKGVVHF